MKIKTKDIIILIIATLIIIGSVATVFVLLNPAPAPKPATNSDVQTQVSPNIDENTYKKIDSLSDYGQPNLSNLGKSNLFQ